MPADSCHNLLCGVTPEQNRLFSTPLLPLSTIAILILKILSTFPCILMGILSRLIFDNSNCDLEIFLRNPTEKCDPRRTIRVSLVLNFTKLIWKAGLR